MKQIMCRHADCQYEPYESNVQCVYCDLKGGGQIVGKTCGKGKCADYDKRKKGGSDTEEGKV